MPVPADAQSKRKPYNHLAGYKASRKNPFTGDWVVIYVAAEADIDVEPDRYAVSCEAHSTLVGASSMALARASMKNSDLWCEACQALANGGSDREVPGYPDGYFTD
jgi:hypothetical protein